MQIFVHDSLEELYEYIPKDVLPDIYGGTGGSIEQFEGEYRLLHYVSIRVHNSGVYL